MAVHDGAPSNLSLRKEEESFMNYLILPKATQVVVPTTSAAYFGAAGFFLLAGILLLAIESA